MQLIRAEPQNGSALIYIGGEVKFEMVPDVGIQKSGNLAGTD